MWDDILKSIAELARRDKDLKAFGARHHGYRFGPKVGEDAIRAFEAAHNFRLPPALRSYYPECGNGGAGPFYGVAPLERLGLYNPDRPFLDTEYLRALAKQHTDPDDDDADYDYESENVWYVPEDVYQGLVGVIEYGCGTEICVIVNGEHAGDAIWKSPENGIFGRESFQKMFTAWLKEELGRLPPEPPRPWFRRLFDRS